MVTQIQQFPDIADKYWPYLDEANSSREDAEIEPIKPVLVEQTIPSVMLLGTLSDGRLKVCSPITLKLSSEEDHIMAEAVDINEFGFGKNSSEALRDLQRTIVELYLTLKKEQDRLGDDLQNVWSNLQQKIIARS